MNEFKTYSFYTKKKQRVAAFATRIQGENILHIGIFICSRKDHFSKTISDMVYHNWVVAGYPETVSITNTPGVVYHPIVEKIPIIDNKPKKTFLEWMKANYYKMDYQRFQYTQEILTKPYEKAISYRKPVRTSIKIGDVW